MNWKDTHKFTMVASREEERMNLGKTFKKFQNYFLILNMKQIWENNIGLFLEFMYDFLLYFYGTVLYFKMKKQAKIRENISPSEHKSYFSLVVFFVCFVFN